MVCGLVLIAMGTSRFVDGIYGRTRNPLYLGATLVYLGLSVAAGSLWAIVLVVPLLWVINVGVIAREECYLERKFGESHDPNSEYKQWVRRLYRLGLISVHVRQKSLKRVGDNSVYRTVCWIFLCPNQACSALVSWPRLASA